MLNPLDIGGYDCKVCACSFFFNGACFENLLHTQHQHAPPNHRLSAELSVVKGLLYAVHKSYLLSAANVSN